MKIIDIISSAASNMIRSKVRTLLTIIAIFIGAFTITLTIGISSGISTYIDNQVGNVGAKDALIIQPKIEMNIGTGPQKYDPNKSATSAQAALATMLSAKDVAKIKSVNGLTEVKPIILTAPNYIFGKNNVKYQIGIRPFIDSMIYDFRAGKIASNKTSQNQIMVTTDYAKVLGFSSDENAIGKEVSLGIKTPLGEQREVKAIIAAVIEKSILSQGGMTANDALVNSLYKVQTEGMPAEMTEKYIEVIARFEKDSSQKEIDEIKIAIKSKGFAARTVEDQIGIIKNVIDAITGVLVFFGAIALIAASFGIINTLFMSVQERTKEIGLMKAMGMSRAKVFLLFSIEAIMLGFWGSLLGVLTAMGVGQIINNIASNGFLKDLPGFDLTLFPITSVAGVMLSVMMIAFLAGTLPSRRAANQDPIKALRYE